MKGKTSRADTKAPCTGEQEPSENGLPTQNGGGPKMMGHSSHALKGKSSQLNILYPVNNILLFSFLFFLNTVLFP